MSVQNFPVNKSYKRLFAEALDSTFSHATYAELEEYIKSATAYPGQFLYCEETDEIYRLDKNKTVQKIKGAIPEYNIGTGTWWVDGTDTGVAAGKDGAKGDTGTTFTPSVDKNGDLSWTNDGELNNPLTVNIKGPQGEQGPAGPAGANGKDGLTTTISVNDNTYTHVNGTITLPDYPNIKTVTQEEALEILKNGSIESDIYYSIIGSKYGKASIYDNLDYSTLENGIYEITTNEVMSFTSASDLNSETFTLSDENNEIEKVFVVGLKKLTKFISSTTRLKELIFANCSNLKTIHLNGCPICNDKKSLLKMAEYLNDRNNMAWGSIVITNKNVRKKVEDAFIAKDWYFGSPIQFNESELAKCQKYMIDTGILDIWESAEYGEGTSICILDSGLDLNLRELNLDNFVGYENISDSTNGKDDPLPDYTDSKHGACITTIAVGQGSRYYGIAPKAKFGFVKITNRNKTATSSLCYNLGCRWARENCFDVVNFSYQATEFITNAYYDYTKYIPACTKDITEYVNSSCQGIFVTSAGNNKTFKDAYVVPNSVANTIVIGGWEYTDTTNTKTQPFEFNDYYYGNMFLTCAVKVRCEQTPNGYAEMTGTSVSSPIGAAMILLAINLYKKKYGYKPNRSEIIQFLKYRCRYADTNNQSNLGRYYGYGIIDFSAYNPNPIKDSDITLYPVE